MLSEFLGLNTALSIFAFLVLAVIYFYGKNSVSHKIDYVVDHQVWKDGTFVFGTFFFLPGTTAYILSVQLVNSIPRILYILPVSLSFLAFIAGFFLSKRYFDKVGLDLEDKELNFLSILGFVAVSFFGILTTITGYYVHWSVSLMPGFMLFIYGILLSGYLGKLDKNYRDVIVDHEEGETEGLLIRMNDDFLYLATHRGVEILNRDSVHQIKDIKINYENGVRLKDSQGVHGGFNHVIRSRDLSEKIDMVRTSMANWMKNENFKGFEDEEIDVAIVYEYTDEDHALDLDNLIKPVISALEKNREAGDGEWLVEDDSQIKQIKAKSIEQKDIGQDFVKVEKKDGEWIEAHGRLTISFREHSEKPMELIRSKVM